MIRHLYIACGLDRQKGIESQVDELFVDLIFGRYRFKSTHWNYEEALLRLIRYCDQYVYPKITQFTTAIIEAI
jgi:hypothetical protein